MRVALDDGSFADVDALTYEQSYAGRPWEHAVIERLCHCHECGVCHWWNRREAALERDRLRQAEKRVIPIKRKPPQSERERIEYDMDLLAMRDPHIAAGRRRGATAASANSALAPGRGASFFPSGKHDPMV